MSENATEETVKETAKKGKGKSETPGLTAKDIIGKVITLKNNIVWSNGAGLHLSAISDDDGNTHHSQEVEKGQSDSYYQYIIRSIEQGQIQIASKDNKVVIENKDINDEASVEMIEEIDYLLHLGPKSFERELEQITRQRPNHKGMLLKLEETESKGRKREDYLDIIRKQIG